MSEVIVITSGKGGVGKTTTTANLGVCLAQMDYKVVMIDTDIGLRNLDVVMGLENRIVYNIIDIVEGSCRVRQAMIRDRRYPCLYMIPAAQTREKSDISPEQMKKLVQSLRSEFDYILIDCPAGIEQGFQVAVSAADRALVVTTPEISSVRDADRVIGLLFSHGISDVRLIINRIRPSMIRKGQMLKPQDIADILCIELIGLIMDHEQIVISTNRGTPVASLEDECSHAYQNICNRICGIEEPFPDIENISKRKKRRRKVLHKK